MQIKILRLGTWKLHTYTCEQIISNMLSFSINCNDASGGADHIICVKQYNFEFIFFKTAYFRTQIYIK